MAGPRAHFRDYVFKNVNGVPYIVSGATAWVYTLGTTTPITQVMYDGQTSSGILTNPLTSDANGLLEFWVPGEQTVTISIPATATYSAQTKEGIALAYDGGP